MKNKTKNRIGPMMIPFIDNLLVQNEYEIIRPKDGSPAHYKWDSSKIITFVANDPFLMTMTFVETTKAQNSVKMKLRDEIGNIHWLFYSSFDDVIQNMNDGVVSGCWQYSKKGNKYGLNYLGKLACIGCNEDTGPSPDCPKCGNCCTA